MPTKKALDNHDIHPGPHKSVKDDIKIMRRPDGRIILEPLKPKSMRDATPAQREAADHIQGLARMIAMAVSELPEAVAIARDSGLSWDAIGWNMGITGQAVRKRFGE